MAQLEDQTDQLEGMKRTKVELMEMQEVEKEYEEDVAMQQAMHDQYMRVPVINLEESGAPQVTLPPPPPPPSGACGSRDPMSGFPVWRAQ
eukprot:4782173-Pyramimonas_sp.AAC.1